MRDIQLLNDLQNAFQRLTTLDSNPKIASYLLDNELELLCKRVSALSNKLNRISSEEIARDYNDADVKSIFQFYELALKKAIKIEEEFKSSLSVQNLKKIQNRIKFFENEINPKTSNLKYNFRFILNAETRLPTEPKSLIKAEAARAAAAAQAASSLQAEPPLTEKQARSAFRELSTLVTTEHQNYSVAIAQRIYELVMVLQPYAATEGFPPSFVLRLKKILQENNWTPNNFTKETFLPGFKVALEQIKDTISRLDEIPKKVLEQKRLISDDKKHIITIFAELRKLLSEGVSTQRALRIYELVNLLDSPIAFSVYPRSFLLTLKEIIVENNWSPTNLAKATFISRSKSTFQLLKETINYFLDEDVTAIEKSKLDKKPIKRAQPQQSLPAEQKDKEPKPQKPKPKIREQKTNKSPDPVSSADQDEQINELAQLIMSKDRANLPRIKGLLAKKIKPIYPFTQKKEFADGVAVFLLDFEDRDIEILKASIPSLKRKIEKPAVIPEKSLTEEKSVTKRAHRTEPSKRQKVEPVDDDMTAVVQERTWRGEATLALFEEKQIRNFKPTNPWTVFLLKRFKKQHVSEITEANLHELSMDEKNKLLNYCTSVFSSLRKLVIDGKTGKAYADPVKTLRGEISERASLLQEFRSQNQGQLRIEDYSERLLIPCYQTRKLLLLLGLKVIPLKNKIEVQLPEPIPETGAANKFFTSITNRTRLSKISLIAWLGLFFPDFPLSSFFIGESNTIHITNPEILEVLKRVIYDLLLQGDADGEVSNDRNSLFHKLDQLWGLGAACTNDQRYKFIIEMLDLLPSLEQLVKDENNNLILDPVFNFHGVVTQRNPRQTLSASCLATRTLLGALGFTPAAPQNLAVCIPEGDSEYPIIVSLSKEQIITLLHTMKLHLSTEDHVAFEFARIYQKPISLQKLRSWSTADKEIIYSFYKLFEKYNLTADFFRIVAPKVAKAASATRQQQSQPEPMAVEGGALAQNGSPVLTASAVNGRDTSAGASSNGKPNPVTTQNDDILANTPGPGINKVFDSGLGTEGAQQDFFAQSSYAGPSYSQSPIWNPLVAHSRSPLLRASMFGGGGSSARPLLPSISVSPRLLSAAAAAMPTSLMLTDDSDEPTFSDLMGLSSGFGGGSSASFPGLRLNAAGSPLAAQPASAAATSPLAPQQSVGGGAAAASALSLEDGMTDEELITALNIPFSTSAGYGRGSSR